VDRSHGFAVPDPSSDPDAHAKIASENELIVRLRNDALAQQEEEKLNYLLEHLASPLKIGVPCRSRLPENSFPAFRSSPTGYATVEKCLGITKGRGGKPYGTFRGWSNCSGQ
jgi:hypothetical protein